MNQFSLPREVSRANGGRPYRVVQWATGNIGTKALRGVLEHPGMELAGLYVYSADKVGCDAGELCGLGPVGVFATDSVDGIIDIDADCVLYMPRELDADVVAQLLAAGTNVVTTAGHFHHPGTMDTSLRKQISSACDLGGTSIYSTGSSPGFITEALPLVLSSIQRSLEELTIDEYADLSQRDSPELLFGIMGFGQLASDFDASRAGYLGHSFGPSLRLVADALGLTVDSIEAYAEVAVAAHEMTIAAGTIDAGTVAAMRTTIIGRTDGGQTLRFRANWYCTTDIHPAWELRDTGWHVSVAGDAPLEVTLRFPISLDRMAETSPGYTANRAVNAIPAVCAAEPGIRSTLDLPHIVPLLA